MIALGIRAVNAFIKNRSIEGGPSQYYLETANSSYLLQVTTYATQTLVGDGFLVSSLIAHSLLARPFRLRLEVDISSLRRVGERYSYPRSRLDILDGGNW